MRRGRDDPTSRASRHHQGLPRRRGERRRIACRDAGGDPRRARRERRRQEHPDEDHLRGDGGGSGRDLLGRRAGADPEPGRGPAARHRHGVPALLAVRVGVRRGEHRGGGGRALRSPGALRPRARAVATLRPAAGSRPPPRPPLRGGAPAGRDRALPPAASQAADPRRADLGAHAPGREAPVRDPARDRGGRVQPPLHQPQARRDPRALRQRHRPSARRGRRRRRSEGRVVRRARGADDRRRAPPRPAARPRDRSPCRASKYGA